MTITDYKTRADLANHPAFSYLDRDSDGNPCVWEFSFHCEEGHDPEHWTSRWTCGCDDDCPVCGAATEPEGEEWIGPRDPALRAFWESLPEAGAHEPDLPQDRDQLAHEVLTLDPRQFCTVLAALRFWQRVNLGGGAVPLGPTSLGLLERDIATDEGTLAPLSAGEIDELIEQINTPAYVSGAATR